MNMNAMMKQLQQVQKKVAAAQQNLEASEFTGEAGGGKVRVAVGKERLFDKQAVGRARKLAQRLKVQVGGIGDKQQVVMAGRLAGRQLAVQQRRRLRRQCARGGAQRVGLQRNAPRGAAGVQVFQVAGADRTDADKQCSHTPALLSISSRTASVTASSAKP